MYLLYQNIAQKVPFVVNSPFMVNRQMVWFINILYSYGIIFSLDVFFLRAAMLSCGLQTTFPNLLRWLLLS